MPPKKKFRKSRRNKKRFGGNQYTGSKSLQQFEVREPEKAPQTCEEVSEESSSDDEGDETSNPSLSASERKLQSLSSDCSNSLDVIYVMKTLKKLMDFVWCISHSLPLFFVRSGVPKTKKVRWDLLQL